ncbi:hypothetical protein VTN31DRAFT_3690 [Thermomyces dupontii]|uniref:uncharacterized protein n=1 Tax=Talaromyces thermophilus TaxID=28565 RepID=UPI00374210BE
MLRTRFTTRLGHAGYYQNRFFRQHGTIPRLFSTQSRRLSQEQEQSSYRSGMAAYRSLVRPFAKVFLTALFTYQVLYWGWLKLESYEMKATRNDELKKLEAEARRLPALSNKAEEKGK